MTYLDEPKNVLVYSGSGIFGLVKFGERYTDHPVVSGIDPRFLRGVLQSVKIITVLTQGRYSPDQRSLPCHGS